MIHAIGREYGSSGYTAPEQHEKGGNVARETDIYALGAVLCAMLTGTPPVVVEGVPQCSGGNIPRELSDVIIKAVAREMQSRYASVNALRSAIEKMLISGSKKKNNAG